MTVFLYDSYGTHGLRTSKPRHFFFLAIHKLDYILSLLLLLLFFFLFLLLFFYFFFILIFLLLSVLLLLFFLLIADKCRR